MIRPAWLAFVLLSGCVVLDPESSPEDTDGSPAEGSDTGDAPETTGTPEDPEPPGDDDEAPGGELFEGGTYWRVDLVGGGEEATITALSSVEIPEGTHEPVPILDGPFMLVGRAGGEVVGARAVAFPAGTVVELDLGEGAYAADELLFATSPQAVFFPQAAGAEVLELVRGSDGAVLDEVGAEELEHAGTALRNANMITAAYPTIRVFGPGEEAQLPAEFQGTYAETIIEVDTQIANAVLAGLDDLPPALTSSISGIAIVEPANKGCVAAGVGCTDGDGGAPRVNAFCAAEGLQQNDDAGDPTSTALLNGAAVGSYLVLNVHSLPWTGTIAHEATHNFNNRIDTRSSAAANASWGAAEVADAKDVVRKYALGAGLSSTWYELHHSVYEAEVGPVIEAPPPGSKWDGWCTLDSATAVQGGFATPYGALQVAEDIAEYASQVIIEGASAPVCAQFSGQSGQDEFPEELALPYTKLVMLQSLGVLTDAQFDDCTGGIEIGRGAPGIELTDQVFTTELKAGFYESGGVRYFAILGQGVEQWQLLYEAAVPEGSSPIGAHRFGAISGFTIPFGLPENGAYLNHPETPRASLGGLFVVSEISDDAVTGAVFNLWLGNAFGLPTSFDSYSSFRIPL